MNNPDNTNDQANRLENKLIKNLLRETRATRRWRNFRFIVWTILIVFFIVILFSPKKPKATSAEPKKPYVSLVRLQGPIMAGKRFSARKVNPILRKAFSDKHSKGVVIIINSPGGSPVQASIIRDNIIHLKNKYKKKVVVIGQDALASGAYLVATGADKIFVHNDTLTGSIGVIMSGFGFTGAMEKLGITRRVFTAGTNKDRLDPFKPLKPADEAKAKAILAVAHNNFIADVKAGRKGKLKGDPSELFSGDFWLGSEAVKLGLADGIGNLWTIMKQEFNVSHYRDYSRSPSLLQVLIHGIDQKLGVGLALHGPALSASLRG